MDPERRNAVLLVAGIAAIVALALGLVAYGYYSDRVAPKRATVLIVGDSTFDYSYLERRAHAALAEGDIKLGSSEDITLGVVQTLDKIEREELVRRAAATSGISVTQQEVDEAMRRDLRVQTDASREQFAPVLREELLRLGLPLDEYEAIARANVLEEKLREQQKAAVPSQLDHADLRLIQLPSEERANEAKQRITSGESPAVVAASMSVHASKPQAGELGWTPRGALPDNVDEVAFNQTGVSDVITDPTGWFIVETRGVESREVAPKGRDQVAEHSLTNLLDRTRDEVGRDNKLTTGQVIRVGRSLLDRG